MKWCIWLILYIMNSLMALVTAQNLIVCFSCKIHRWLETAASDSSRYLDAILRR